MPQRLCVSYDAEVDDEPRAFADLDEATKTKALDVNRDFAVCDNWWGSTYADAERMGQCLGITIDHSHRTSAKTGQRIDQGPSIFFSGFCSQGDGACWIGRIEPRIDAAAAIAAEAPQDETLKQLATDCALVQVTIKLEHGCHGYANVRSVGRDSHSGTMEADCYLYDGDQLEYDLADVLLPLARRFADWIYTQLEAEYQYLTSDEYLTEYFSESDYRFDSNGRII